MLRTSCLHVLGESLANEWLQSKLTEMLCILTVALLGIPELKWTAMFLLGRMWTMTVPPLSLCAVADLNGRRGVCPNMMVTLAICPLRCPLA